MEADIPTALKGREIPIGARILAAVDCFDAIASDRPYRRALPLHEVMAHIKHRSGTQFDPQVVRVLARRYEDLEIKAREESKKMVPLHTEFIVRRGDAPSAGFQTDALSHGDNHESLDLIEETALETRMLHELDTELNQALGNAPELKDALSLFAGKLEAMIPFDLLVILLSHENVLLCPVSSQDKRRLVC